MPVAPLGFCLQRVSLRSSPSSLSTVRALHAVFSRQSDRSHPSNDRGSKDLSIRKVRALQGGFTRNPEDRSSLGLASPRFFLVGLDLVLPRSLLSWALTFRRTVARPSSCVLYRVSKNRRVGATLSSRPSLREVHVVAVVQEY